MLFYSLCIFICLKRCRHQAFAKHFGDPKPLCFNKCDNEANDRDIDKRPMFLKTIQLKDRLLKKLICATSKPPDRYISYSTVAKYR